MLRRTRSVIKLCWLVIREGILVLAALVRRDCQAAGGRARLLAISVHNDLLLFVAACQRHLLGWRAPAPGIDRILIVKLDRIGDMVTTTPIFDVLRQLFPRARLDIIGHPGPLGLLEGDPRVGERIPYTSWLYHPAPIRPAGPSVWRLVCKLLRRRYPLVVYLRGSFPFLALGITSRLAATKFVVAEPVIARYLKALESVVGPVPHPEPRLHVLPRAARLARSLLHGQARPSAPRVVIHAGASTATKVWPAARYATLADRLVEDLGAEVHFLGSPDDKPCLEQIIQLAAHPHVVHCSLRLSEVIAVTAACDLFIGNDSGLSHIAAAVGTRMVVLWGPANLSMARPRATPERCAILYHDLPCRERCPEFQCINPVALECLMRIQPDQVLEAVHRVLDRLPERGSCLSLPVVV